MSGWIKDAEQLEAVAHIVETEAPSVFHLTNASAAQASTLRSLAAELRRRAAIGEPYPSSDREWRGGGACGHRLQHSTARAPHGERGW